MAGARINCTSFPACSRLVRLLAWVLQLVSQWLSERVCSEAPAPEGVSGGKRKPVLLLPCCGGRQVFQEEWLVCGKHSVTEVT